MQHGKHTSSSPAEGLSTKEKVLFGILGIAVIGGAIIIGKKVLRKAVSNKVEKSTLTEGSSATYAKQIKMAFDNDGWLGTNTKALRATILQIKTKTEFEHVMKDYQRLYHRPLLQDMGDELQTSEYNEMLSILSAKPIKQGAKPTPLIYEAWAKRLKAAFDKSYGFLPGTDEAAIKAVLQEIPSQTAFKYTEGAYQRLYAVALRAAMEAESQWGEYNEWMKIIQSKPMQ